MGGDDKSVQFACGAVVWAGERLGPANDPLVVKDVAYTAVRGENGPPTGRLVRYTFPARGYAGECWDAQRYTFAEFMRSRDAGFVTPGQAFRPDSPLAPPAVVDGIGKPTTEGGVAFGWPQRAVAPGLDLDAVKSAARVGAYLDPGSHAYMTGSLAHFMRYAFACSYDRIGTHLAGHRAYSGDDLVEAQRMLAAGFAACVQLERFGTLLDRLLSVPRVREAVPDELMKVVKTLAPEYFTSRQDQWDAVTGVTDGSGSPGERVGVDGTVVVAAAEWEPSELDKLTDPAKTFSPSSPSDTK